MKSRALLFLLATIGAALLAACSTSPKTPASLPPQGSPSIIAPTATPQPIQTTSAPTPSPTAILGPALGTVSYTENGQQIEVTSRPGQIIVVFPVSLPEDQARAKITAEKGTMVDSVPQAGFYLATMTPGTEGAFMEAILRAGADFAGPVMAISEAPLNTPSLSLPSQSYQPTAQPTVHVFDLCSRSHGPAVVKVLTDRQVAAECHDVDDGTGHFDPMKLVRGIYKLATDNAGAPTLINVSAGADCQQRPCYFPGLPKKEQTDLFNRELLFQRYLLATLRSLPTSIQENVVLFKAAGNIGMPLDDLKAALSSDSKLAPIVSQNFLIVTTDQMGAGTSRNQASNASQDRDVVTIHNVEARDGTSFAAPAAAAGVAKAIGDTGSKATETLKFAKDLFDPKFAAELAAAAKDKPLPRSRSDEVWEKLLKALEPDPATRLAWDKLAKLLPPDSSPAGGQITPTPIVTPTPKATPTPAPTATSTPTPAITSTLSPARDLSGKWSGGYTETTFFSGSATCINSGQLALDLQQNGDEIKGTLTYKKTRAQKATPPAPFAYECILDSTEYTLPIQGSVSSSGIKFTDSEGEAFVGSFTSDLMQGTFSSSDGEAKITGCFKVSRTGGLPGC